MIRLRPRWALTLALPAFLSACAPASPQTLPLVFTPENSILEATVAPLTTAEATPAPMGEVLRPTALQFELPSTGVQAAPAWRPPPYPVPWVVRPGDHFYFARPIASGEVNWPNAQYRYGTTFFGEETTHTGVDFGAQRGTAVLAAGPGEVVWTGYGLYRGVERADDPYGLAIAIRHDFGHEGRTLYTVYAHMRAVYVWVGQRVESGEPIGEVGETGHATGAHLHFEVRLGENSYFATVNPELWMVPPEGWGVLAGHILGTVGQPLAEQAARIISLDSGQRWDVWSYAKETVHPDEVYQENFVISDLPAGPYRVEVDFVGRTFATEILVLAGQTNLVTFRGRYGFIPEPTPTSGPSNSPPYP